MIKNSLLLAIVLVTCGETLRSVQCPGPHEVYACGPACDTVCATLGEICPIVNIRCNNMCYCRIGYARNDKNICIPITECPVQCRGSHEVYACGPACDNVCATLGVQNRTYCPIVNFRCTDMCYCEIGYARDDNNTCIPIWECPDTSSSE